MTDAAAGTVRANVIQGGTVIEKVLYDLVEAVGKYQPFGEGPTPFQIAAGLSVDTIAAAIEAAHLTVENILVIPAAVAAASQNPNSIALLRGDTYLEQLPQMGDLTGYTKLIFTAKVSLSDLDSAAILQIVLNASGGTNGLITLNGAAASDHTQASLTITNLTSGLVNIMISNLTAAVLPVDQKLFWDCQMDYSGGDRTPISGDFTVTADVTRATS